MNRWILATCLAVAACAPADRDEDGFEAPEDCDDDAANVNPDAVDIRDNGIDEDCDGEDRPAAPYIGSWLLDFDGQDVVPLDGDVMMEVRATTATLDYTLSTEAGPLGYVGSGEIQDLVDEVGFTFALDGTLTTEAGQLDATASGECSFAQGLLDCTQTLAFAGEEFSFEFPLGRAPGG